MSDLPPVVPPDYLANSAPRDISPRTHHRRWLRPAAVIVVAVIAGGGWYFSNSQGQTTPANGPGAGARQRLSPIVVESARTADFPLRLAAIGTVVPRNIVTVRSRVDGTLDRVYFEEGQLVRAGEVLAEVDRRPFEVALTQSQGQLGKNQALLANARADLARYEGLAKLDAIPSQQLDTQRALVGQYEASIKADQGAVDGARLQLSYTRITAPFAGRVGLRQVDPGNVVRASDTNGIVVITQVQPVSVVFPIPEAELGKLLARLGLQAQRQTRGETVVAGASRPRSSAEAATAPGADGVRRSERPAGGVGGAARGDKPRRERTSPNELASRAGGGGNQRPAAPTGVIEVEAWDRDGKTLLATGTLLTVDNQLDATTGTVKVKAVFPNTDGALFPNQFVNVRLVVSELKDATVIPSAAVQRGSRGSFVWLLKDEDKTVSMRPVSIGHVDGESVAVLEGLKAGDLVAVDGFDRLREGAKVEVVTRESRAVKEGTGKPREGRRGQGGQGGPRGEGGSRGGGPRPQS